LASPPSSPPPTPRMRRARPTTRPPRALPARRRTTSPTRADPTVGTARARRPPWSADDARTVAGVPQTRDDEVGVLAAARLHVDLDLDLADLEIEIVTRVAHFDDVRVRLRDRVGDDRELARAVGQRDDDLEVALRGREAAAHDALEEHRVDVAA